MALQGAPTRVRMVSQEHTIGEKAIHQLTLPNVGTLLQKEERDQAVQNLGGYWHRLQAVLLG